MKRQLNFLAAVLLVASSLISCQKDWKLVWQEEFEGEEIDWTVWSKIPRGKPDWKHYMCDNDTLFDLRDGNLILRGVVNDGLEPQDSVPYLTGGVYSMGKKAFSNGKLEIRARLHGAQGAWPAIWMVPDVNPRKWPDDGEIDIMERLNADSIAYQTIHTNYTLNLGGKEEPLSHITAPIDPDDYNVYGVELAQDYVRFFINGVETLTYPRIETDKPGQFPFADNPFYLIMDMQLEGNWVGKADPADLPVEMEIDWVRFYQK